MSDARRPTARDRESGREIAQRRKTYRLSQDVVAAHVGISKQQLSKYELGKNRMSVDRHERILESLEILDRGEGFSESPQAAYNAPIAKSAIQTGIDQMRASLDLWQKYLDQN